MARKPKIDTPMPADMSSLSDEDRVSLSREAAKSVKEESEQVSRDAFYAAEVSRLRAARIPADRLVHVTVDIAQFAANIMLDGVQYFHGFTYEVPHRVRLVLMEQMQRTWQHQDEIDGRSRFAPHRRPMNLQLGPQHMGTPTRGANGVVEAEV